MFEKLKEKREQREQQRLEEQARLEEARRIEMERLQSLSEKELLIEVLLELRTINGTCSNISSKCDDIDVGIMMCRN